MRDRFARDAAKLRTAYNAALWAMEKHLKSVNREISEELRSLRSEIEKQFGLIASAASRLGGPFLLYASRKEEQRLASGWTYEPPTFLERTNWGKVAVTVIAFWLVLGSQRGNCSSTWSLKLSPSDRKCQHHHKNGKQSHAGHPDRFRALRENRDSPVDELDMYPVHEQGSPP